MVVAVVIGGVMAVLLQFKKPLHALAGAIGERDMKAIMQFVLLSLVILPVLPHQDFGPYGVWNPFQIWLMAVLIVGICLTGYIAYKCLGARRGTLLAGVLGGLISSTATTVSYAPRTVENTKLVNLATVVIVVASCISLGRVLIEMAAVAPIAFAAMASPVAAILAVSIIIAVAMFFWQPSGDAQMPEQKNPAELKPAFIFAAIYAVVLLAVAIAKEHFGSAGFYTVAIVSGLTDMDAITLSSARLVESGHTDFHRLARDPDRGNVKPGVQVRDCQLAWPPLIDPAHRRGLRLDPYFWRSGPVVLACLNRGLMIDGFYLIDALLTVWRKCAE